MEERNIPIDINAGKLLEWLISRRHCDRTWQDHVLVVRSKINNAIQNMPEHEGIARLVTGTYINYFHCQKIINILEETEADSKNLFGRYGSQRMKDWKEIIRLYEKDNLYLAEAAQILIRNINYEIPSLKKQIHKLDQTKRDLEKNIVEYKKSELTAQSEFNTLCKNLGISGQDIKKELVERIIVLPKIYDEIVNKCQALSDVITFYEAFTSFTLGRKSDKGCVPIVQHIIEKGNTTTYEWIYGEVPDSVMEPLLEHAQTNQEETSSIDFGDADDYLCLDNSNNVNNTIELNWSTVDSVFISNENENIDEGVTLEESGIVVETINMKTGVATGNEALRILDNSKTRDEFIDQLLELEAFLKLRLYEFKNERHGHPNISQIQDSSTILQLSSLDSIQYMLDNVQIVLSAILDNQVQHLHQIKHSPRYLDVLTEMIEQKRGIMEKMIAVQQKNIEKQHEVTKQTNDLQPLLNIVIQRTKELQIDIEKDISKKYQSRPVQLTGIINQM